MALRSPSSGSECSRSPRRRPIGRSKPRRAPVIGISTPQRPTETNGRPDAIADSDVPRDQLYVVTELWNADPGYDGTLRAFPYVSGQHGPPRARLSRPVP